MGKIRIKTIGQEDQEKEEKRKAKARAEAKKAQGLAQASEQKENKTEEKTAAEPQETSKAESTDKKSKKPVKGTKGKSEKKHSDNYLTVAANIDKNKKYQLQEAINLLEKLKRAKFDETVELHINTIGTGISGNVTLPHGTGKKVRVEIANLGDDPKHIDEIVKKVESGQIDFDVLIATPDSMPRLAKIARVLGPRGLMPNPKNGTISTKPSEVVKKYEGGQVNFKTEAKFPLLHLAVGKISFGDKKLTDNIKAAVSAVKTKNIQNLTIKSTMSPGISVSIDSL